MLNETFYGKRSYASKPGEEKVDMGAGRRELEAKKHREKVEE